MQPMTQGPIVMPSEEERPETEAGDDIEAENINDSASSGEAAARPVVFISHRCLIEPDRSLALRLYKDLNADCNVYVNTMEPAGVPFDEKIEDSLKNASFVIGLITASANESPWVQYELSYAAERYQRARRPTIIPVRVGFTGQYSPRIGASISGFNPVYAEPGDYDEILKQVQAAIANRPPEIEPLIFGIEGFMVGEFRKKLMRAACLNSLTLRDAGETLRQKRLLWVVGAAGVRNHFARSLAISEHDRHAKSGTGKEPGRNILEVPRSLNWSKIDDTLVRDSIIIFPDVMPSQLFDEESNRDELRGLKRLAARNLVIFTSKGPYSEIEQELRSRDFEDGAYIVLNQSLYNEGARLEIFERLLDYSFQSGDLTRKQQQWAHNKLLEESEGRAIFKTILDKWTPADIERFVTRHLREVRSPDDILKLLQRNADLDNEIHTWFIALDDSTRCFVLSLAMLSGLRKEQVWEKYKLIVQKLKKLDANLSRWPLGICRQRAAPYVTTEGQLDFVDELVGEAVYREVAMNFREYLIELVPLIKQMSVPTGREYPMTKEVFASRKLKAAEDRELRDALARVTGKAGRQGLEDLTELLDFWGTDPILPIREAVARALEQAVTERTGAKHALSLMEKWCNGASHPNEALYRMWAAAAALGSIIAAIPGTDTCRSALYLLERLAGAEHASLKFYVSISLKKLARKLSLVEDETPVSLATLLSLVARDEQAATRINVAEALIEARLAHKNEDAVLDFIRKWAAGQDADCRWAAICSLLLWRKQKNEERNREITGFLAQDAQTTAEVLVETLNHKYQKMPHLWQCFKNLVLDADDLTKRALVKGLADLSPASLEEKLLPLLSTSGNPLLDGLVAEVQAVRWRRLFSTPHELIIELCRAIRQERRAGEVHRSLLQLLKPEPEGCRSDLVRALVSCFAEHRVTLEQLLTKLTSVSPPLFEPLAIEVRCDGLRGLFSDPQSFMSVVMDDLSRPELSGETCVALELLSQPEPGGNRAELLQVLAYAQTLDAAQSRALTRQLRATLSSTLSRLVYEFKLQTLVGDLSHPEQFLSRVTEAMRDAQERAGVLQILEQLSASEPQGQRRRLVQALGAARVTRPQEVDALLQYPSWQPPAIIFGLGTQVKIFSFISKIFSSNIASQLFAPNR